MTKVFYSVLIFTGQFTFSLLAGIIAPALIDIRLLLQQNGTVSLRSVALMFTFYFVGSILGSFISIAYKSVKLQAYINRQLVTSLLMIVFALSIGAIPYGRSIWTLYALVMLGGIGCSNWNVVGTTWLIELWNDRPKVMASMLQAQQFAFGLGTVAAPWLVKPYLSGLTKTDAAELVLTTEEVEVRRGRLAIPFALCAGIESAVGFIFLLTYLLKSTRYVKAATVASKDDKSAADSKLLDRSEHNFARAIFKIAFIVIFIFFSVCELGHISFQNTYFQLLPGMNISAQEAAEIASITAVTYTFGRAVSVFISGLLSSAAILNVHFTLCLLGFGTFFWSATQSRIWLWVNSAVAGYALSPIRSSMFAYVNAYTTADDRLNAFLFISICIGSVFSPLIIGPYIETMPSILIYLDLVSVGVALCTFIAVQALVRRKATVQQQLQSTKN